MFVLFLPDMFVLSFLPLFVCALFFICSLSSFSPTPFKSYLICTKLWNELREIFPNVFVVVGIARKIVFSVVLEMKIFEDF